MVWINIAEGAKKALMFRRYNSLQSCTYFFANIFNSVLLTYVGISVADPHHFDADPTYHFDADPTFHFDADPDPDF